MKFKGGAMVDSVEEVKKIRFSIEENGDFLNALKVLKKLIDTTDNELDKVRYYCESLRTAYLINSDVSAGICIKLLYKLTAISKREDNKKEIAQILLEFMVFCAREENLVLFKELDKIYQGLGLEKNNPSGLYMLGKQIIKTIENGDFHPAIRIFLSANFSSKKKNELNGLMIIDAEGIVSRIESIRKNSYLFYKEGEKTFKALYGRTSRDYEAKLEYKLLKRDDSIKKELKKIIFILLSFSNDIIDKNNLNNIIKKQKDIFIGSNTKSDIKDELLILEKNYPKCYGKVCKSFIEDAKVSKKEQGNKKLDERKIEMKEKEIKNSDINIVNIIDFPKEEDLKELKPEEVMDVYYDEEAFDDSIFGNFLEPDDIAPSKHEFSEKLYIISILIAVIMVWFICAGVICHYFPLKIF
ncbi:hypothetical protein [Acetitomaculum ruminis]|nr:hypothetical protein [Acetitomaculum ruminis]